MPVTKKSRKKKRITLLMSEVCEGQIISHPLAYLGDEYCGGQWLILYINRDFKPPFTVNIIKLAKLDPEGRYYTGMPTEEHQRKIPGDLGVFYYGYMEQSWKRGE